MEMEYALWQLCRRLATEKTSSNHTQAIEQVLMRLTIAPQTGILQRRLAEIKVILSKMRHLTVHILAHPEDTSPLSKLLIHSMELRTLLIKELAFSLEKLQQRLVTLEIPVHPLNHGSQLSIHNSLTFVGTLAALDKQFISLAALCDLLLVDALEDITDVQTLIPRVVTILGILIDHKNKLPEISEVPRHQLMDEFMGKLRQSYDIKLLQKALKRAF